MDHEYSTNALNKQQVGWDWFGLHLDDGSNIMWGQLRRPDGSIDVAHGSLSNANGLVQPLRHDAVQVTVVDTWTSRISGARYPAHWRLQIPSAGIDLDITPLINDQELRLSQIIYWEGAVQIRGSATGTGYVELTGYAPGIQQVR
jgi:predicted secreted hydrolase